MLLLSELGREY